MSSEQSNTPSDTRIWYYITLTRDQVQQIAKLYEDRKPYSMDLRPSGGDCGCVHLIDGINRAAWRIDPQGRVQGR